MKYWVWELKKDKCSQKRNATNAIHQCVIQLHLAMLLKGMYSFEGADMTFDQCVWSCIALLPPCMILNVTDGTFFLHGDKEEVHLPCTLNVKQIAFAPRGLWLWTSTAAGAGRAHVQICGRPCRASAGYPGSTVLLRCTPAGCGQPARNPPPPEPGSSHSAEDKSQRRACGQSLNLPFCYYDWLLQILHCFLKFFIYGWLFNW